MNYGSGGFFFSPEPGPPPELAPPWVIAPPSRRGKRFLPPYFSLICFARKKAKKLLIFFSLTPDFPLKKFKTIKTSRNKLKKREIPLLFFFVWGGRKKKGVFFLRKFFFFFVDEDPPLESPKNETRVPPNFWNHVAQTIFFLKEEEMPGGKNHYHEKNICWERTPNFGRKKVPLSG